jgi:hypothetical protein
MACFWVVKHNYKTLIRIRIELSQLTGGGCRSNAAKQRSKTDDERSGHVTGIFVENDSTDFKFVEHSCRCTWPMGAIWHNRCPHHG